MLLAYREDPSFFAVGRALGVYHQTVQRCVEPVITAVAKAWLVDLACRKAKEFGYPHEVWMTRLLAEHAREHGPSAGHACLSDLVQGTVCKILDAEEVKPHRCATTWNVAIQTSPKRWPTCCASIARSNC
jgi:hypothetical protein